MKVQIRRSVFETNSSSSHSVTLYSSVEWDKFVAGELKYNLCSGDLVPVALLSKVTNIDPEDYVTYNELLNRDSDVEYTSTVTPHGDGIVALSIFSYD